MIKTNFLTIEFCTISPNLCKLKIFYHIAMKFIADICDGTTVSDYHWFFVVWFSSLWTQVDPDEIEFVIYCFLQSINVDVCICRNWNKIISKLRLNLSYKFGIDKIYFIQYYQGTHIYPVTV